MNVTNYSNRDRSPINFPDGLYVKGVDIISLVKQVNGEETMAYSTTITTSTERYIATQPGTGYSVGNTIVHTVIFDISGPTPVTTELWHNYSQSTTLTVAPNFSNLSLQGQSALTNTELRSQPLTVITDVLSPEIIRLGDVADPAAPDNGVGSYALLPALKRMVMQLFSINSKLPSSLGRKSVAESLAVVLSTEQENLINSQITKLTDLSTALTNLAGKFPTTLGPKTDQASLSVVMSNQPVEWENVGMVLSSSGSLISETERNAEGNTRIRTWTEVVNGGNTTLTTSGWIYS